MKRSIQAAWLQKNGIRIARVHFGFVGAYALFVVASDAWGVVTRQLTSQRWMMTGTLLIVTTVVWYLARSTSRSVAFYRTLIVLMVLADIALATFAIYTERGMASRGVALYALPIVTSAALLNRSAVFGAALISYATYVMAATRYFYVYFNEGYKAELYTTLLLYGAGFMVLAALIWVVMSSVLEK